MNFLQSWCYLWLLLELVLARNFYRVTQDVGLHIENGEMVAFADLNADKATDILVLNTTTDHTVLFAYVWNHKQGQFIVNELRTFSLPVVAVSVADFDGDGTVDILALFEHGDCYSASIQWCHIEDNQVTTENSTNLPKKFSNRPLVTDANGDHIPDLFGLTCSSSVFSFFISSEARSFSEQPLNLSTAVEGHSPNGSYNVDLDSDCIAEVVLYYDLNGNRSLEVFKRDSKSNWRHLPSMSLLPQLQGAHTVLGEPAFADMDGDGVLEMLVFSCNDSQCSQRAVHTLHQQQFPHDVLSCQGGGENWRLSFSQILTVNLTRSSNSSSHGSHTLLPPRPVIGDLDLDGYPDVIVPIANDTGNSLRPLILLGSGGRGGLRPQWDLLSDPAASIVTQTAFFDLWEDGVLDVLLVQVAGNGEPQRFNAYKQSLSEDHTFLKILALNGHCFSHCKSGFKPYGSVLPGTTVAFSTTDRNGKKERSTSIVHSSSFSLQLPFVLFGLGETPNFIEELTVAAGYGSSNDSVVLVGYHKWSLLVPNSQVIVVMTPHNQPKKWYIELYLTPSHLVYSTAGVLCALSIGIAVIIILLQAREKYQDSKERKQAKHRFHFNAM